MTTTVTTLRFEADAIVPPLSGSASDIVAGLTHAAEFLSAAASAVASGQKVSDGALEGLVWAEAKLLELVRALPRTDYATAVRRVWGREPRELARAM